MAGTLLTRGDVATAVDDGAPLHAHASVASMKAASGQRKGDVTAPQSRGDRESAIDRGHVPVALTLDRVARHRGVELGHLVVAELEVRGAGILLDAR